MTANGLHIITTISLYMQKTKMFGGPISFPEVKNQKQGIKIQIMTQEGLGRPQILLELEVLPQHMQLLLQQDAFFILPKESIGLRLKITVRGC